jgi:outer membrane protein assembly factor BamB
VNDVDVALAGDDLIAVQSGRKQPEVVAFALESGKPRWRLALEVGSTDQRVAGDDHMVYVADAAGQPHRYQVRAVDSSTGNVVWSQPLPALAGPLTVGGDRLVFRTSDGVVHAIHTRDGTPSWEVTLPGGDRDHADRVVANDDVALIAASDGAVIALDASDRVFEPPLARIRWQLPPGSGSPHSLPAISGVAIVAGRTTLAAVDVATGKVRWTRDVGLRDALGGGSSPSQVIVGRDTIVGKFRNAVAALDSSGRQRWIFENATLRAGHDRSVSWSVVDVEPVITDAGIWVAVRSEQCVSCGSASYLLLRLDLAPERAY